MKQITLLTLLFTAIPQLQASNDDDSQHNSGLHGINLAITASELAQEIPAIAPNRLMRYVMWKNPGYGYGLTTNVALTASMMAQPRSTANPAAANAPVAANPAANTPVAAIQMLTIHQHTQALEQQKRTHAAALEVAIAQKNAESKAALDTAKKSFEREMQQMRTVIGDLTNANKQLELLRLEHEGTLQNPTLMTARMLSLFPHLRISAICQGCQAQNEPKSMRGRNFDICLDCVNTKRTHIICKLCNDAKKVDLMQPNDGFKRCITCFNLAQQTHKLCTNCKEAKEPKFMKPRATICWACHDKKR